MINVFEDYGVLDSRHENLGRGGGRKRLVKFKSKIDYEEIAIRILE